MSLKLYPPGTRKGNKHYVAYGWWNGRPLERNLQTTDHHEAETRLLRLQLRLREQSDLPDSGLTFTDAVGLYLKYRSPAPAWKKMIGTLEKEFGFRPAAAITADDILKVALRLYPKSSNATRNRQVLVPVAAILHHASDLGLIPWLRLKKFKEKMAPPKAVARETAEALLNATEGMQHVFLLFLFKQGWRIGEVLRLQWADIDLHDRTVRYFNQKTNEWRVMPFQTDVQTALEQMVKPDRRIGRVFSWGDKSNVYRWLRPLCHRLGIKFTPHMARHSFATWMVNDGATPLDVMEAGGWRDIKSVQRYGRVSRERVRALLDREGTLDNLGRKPRLVGPKS